MQALIFSQLSELVDFVNAFEKDLSSSPSFTLWGLNQLDKSDDRSEECDYLVLSNYRKTGLLKELNLKDYEGKLEVDPSPITDVSQAQATVELHLDQKTKYTCCIAFQHEAVSIQSLLPLQPWQKGLPSATLNQPVLFWIFEPSLATNIVSDHFKIGSDHLEYMVLPCELSDSQSLEHDSVHTYNQSSILIKVHQPSYFLIQRYAEQHSDLKIFYSLCDDLYLEWQYEPILADRWRHGLKQDSEQFSLVSQDLILKANTFSKLDWSDIYELTSFDLNHSLEKSWSPTQDHHYAFNISLSLEPKARPLDAELWLIHATHFDELEQKLSLVDEDDLSQLLISVQQKQEASSKSDSSSENQLRFFVKERQNQHSKSYLDFGGEGFASYMGFHNLYLPVDYELQPRLRRDQYPKLFNLKNGELTVLSLSPQVTQTQNSSKDSSPSLASLPSLKEAKLYKFNEQNFEPLNELVHYIVSSEKEYLHKAKKNTLFNFNKYKSSPSLFAEPRYSELKNLLLPLQKHSPSHQLPAINPQSKDRSKDSAKPKPVDLSDQLVSQTEEISAAPDEAKSTEKQKIKSVTSKQNNTLKLETEATRILTTLLSKSDPSINEEEQWCELGQIYVQLKKSISALEAFTEYFWHSRQETGLGLLNKDLSSTNSTIIQIRNKFGAMGAEQLQLSKVEQKQLNLAHISNDLADNSDNQLPTTSYATACYYFVKIEALEPQERYEPLSHLLKFIQKHSVQWRKKERWLLILGVARLTQDQRLLAQHRESLLNQINVKGLERSDLSGLVVEYLTHSKQMNTDHAEGSDPEVQDLEQGVIYLELIEHKLMTGSSNKILRMLNAPLYVLLARISHEYQLFKQRDRYLKALLPLVDQFDFSSANPSAVYVLILLTRSQGLLSETAANQYGKVIPEAIDLLQADDKTKFRTLFRETLKRSQQQRDKELALLSRQENKNRLFLSFKPERHPEVNALFQSFLTALKSTQKEQIKLEFTNLIRELTKHSTPDDDHQLLAYYLHQINEVIGKVKWLIEGNDFISLFSNLDQKLMTHIKELKHSKFFINLCILTISELQIRMGNTHHAQEQIEWLLESLNQINDETSWIDYIDNSSMALQSLESVDYSLRAPLLGKILDGLQQIMVKTAFSESSIMFMVYLLEQIVEVAMNTELLTENRFQDYTDLEELSLRDALLHDKL